MHYKYLINCLASPVCEALSSGPFFSFFFVMCKKSESARWHKVNFLVKLTHQSPLGRHLHTYMEEERHTDDIYIKDEPFRNFPKIIEVYLRSPPIKGSNIMKRSSASWKQKGEKRIKTDYQRGLCDSIRWSSFN